MQLLKKVEKYITDNQLLKSDEKVIVGVSGGADSMALLHMLVTLGYKCIVAHCNFRLRAEESDRDESFVYSYCSKNSLECNFVSFDTYAYMKEKGISLEMAARELRYNWFEKISENSDIGKIAIAHHLDDSVETFLINLLRGSGIKGLTGIQPQNGKIIRPLLCLTQSEVLEYLTAASLTFVEDSTNTEDVYLRNKIRLNIIPQLKEINPSINHTINQTCTYLQKAETVYRKHIDNVISNVFKNNAIDIQSLINSEIADMVLFEILYPYGFNSSSIKDILESANGISGKIFYSGRYQLVKDRTAFILKKRSDNAEEYFYIAENIKLIDVPVKLIIEGQRNEESMQEIKSRSKAFVDKDLLTFPLHLRKWKQGDRFIPFGMKGSKKLSDYFSDRKFNLFDKQNTWLLCNADDKIIWVVGERADNRFRITEATQCVLKIELIMSDRI